MNWPRVDATVRTAYRKNGKHIDLQEGGTPLGELMEKDPVPDLAAMTEGQLCEYAADLHIPIAEDLTRSELIDAIKGGLEKNWEERLRGMRGTLDYIFSEGPHPLLVYRRIMAITKAIRPQCLLNMSLAQMAVLCDDGKGPRSDGRATQSARVKRLFEEPIKKKGMHGFKASFQKSQSASEVYSHAAKGNKNRLGREFLEHEQTKAAEAA